MEVPNTPLNSYLPPPGSHPYIQPTFEDSTNQPRLALEHGSSSSMVQNSHSFPNEVALVLDGEMNLQNLFLKDRQILDGIMIANEVINIVKKKGWLMLLLKVDFEKAYDSVSWSFLDYMLCRMGFNEKWRVWMKTCICDGSVSVLVNGSPTLEFPMERGLRQGDPLAPFLFLIVAEGLAGLVNNCVESGLLEAVNEVIPFPLLQYADDTLLMCKNSKENVWCLKAVLRLFELVSGLRVNFLRAVSWG